MRRVVAWVARFASRLLFRRVEVAGIERYPAGRPVLLVANHFNGFVDPVLIATALGRLPRFIAKAELKTIPFAGLVLRSVGVVFVHRRADKGGRSNEDAFIDCHRALAKRDVVAIFPEGTTHDRAQIDPIKTGAARIALGACDRGCRRPGDPAGRADVPRQGGSPLLGPRAVRSPHRPRGRGTGGGRG